MFFTTGSAQRLQSGYPQLIDGLIVVFLPNLERSGMIAISTCPHSRAFKGIGRLAVADLEMDAGIALWNDTMRSKRKRRRAVSLAPMETMPVLSPRISEMTSLPGQAVHRQWLHA